MVSIIILYYNIIILWDHRRICGLSLTQTSLCGACCNSTLAFLLTSIHSDRSWAFLLHALIRVVWRSACKSSSHLNFGLPTVFLASSLTPKKTLGILLLSVLIKWPSQSSPLVTMSVTMPVSRYRLLLSLFVVIRLAPLSQMDTSIFTTDGVVWFIYRKDSRENRWFIRNIDTYTPNDTKSHCRSGGSECNRI